MTMARRPPRQPLRLSIRLQISLVLLMSALNGIFLLSFAAAVLASIPTSKEGQGLPQLQQTMRELTALHREVLDGSTSEQMGYKMEELGAQLLALDEEGHDARMALKGYREEVQALEAQLPQAEIQAVERTKTSYHNLLGAVQMLGGEEEPSWLERSPRVLLGLTVWVCLVSLVTILSAFRLRVVLSQPLSRLSQSAITVADGKLDSPIPEVGESSEFHKLSCALESMRQGLVEKISDIDDHNAVQQAMLASLNDGVLMLDREKRVLEFNPRAVEILGDIAPPELSRARGLSVSELLPGLDRQLFSAKQGEPIQLDFTLDGGLRRYLTVNLQPLSGVGRDLQRAYVMVVRDVTRSVELEQLKRNFLSVVTHELKTPLTVVEGYVRLLQMGKGGGLSAKQQEILGKVRAQSELLKSMVQDLLDATRLEGGDMTLSLEEVDVSRTVGDCVESLAAEADRLGLNLVFRNQLPEGTRIEADAFRLEQVVSNLLRNAFKFTPKGGRVVAETDRLGSLVLVAVSDSGRGIPAAAIPHLFEKFYQVERGDTRKAGGAGLGLYICHQLTRAMNGDIQVESKGGEGSRFILSFARQEEPR